MGGCTARGAQPGEVFLTIESGYARDGEDGVDRYELRVYRRRRDSASDRRWVLVSRQRYALGVSEGGSSPDGAVAIRELVGRHVLRASAGTESQPLLIEAWPGRAMTGDAFEPAAQPSVAQFSFPSGFVGRLTLRFEPVCQAFDPLRGDVQRVSYLTCVSEVVRADGVETNCPKLEPICVTFESSSNAALRGEARRRPCDEARFELGGNNATRCARPMDIAGNGADAGAGVDSGTDAGVDGGLGDTVASGVTLRPADSLCRAGAITCGVSGEWSRCVESIPCGRARQGTFACCATRPQPAQCRDPEQQIPRATQCPQGVSCNASTDRCECGQIGQRCCGSACSEASSICDTAGTCRQCGGCETCGAGVQPCCEGDSCNPGYVCSAGRCLRCGGANQPCCAGASCAATSLVCRGGQCLPCGMRNQPCCAGDLCFGFPTGSAALCMSAAPWPLCRCGAEGQICCPSRTCDSGLRCVDTGILPACMR